jgi:hypothetical protein
VPTETRPPKCQRVITLALGAASDPDLAPAPRPNALACAWRVPVCPRPGDGGCRPECAQSPVRARRLASPTTLEAIVSDSRG